MTKEKLEVKRMDSLPTDATKVPQLFDDLDVKFEKIASVNWPEEYPYSPHVDFRIAWCPEGIALHYRVDEQCVRACYGEDNSDVWTDSCVECFIRNADSDTYYNIESNCIGVLLVGLGENRHSRNRLSSDALTSVKRWASLGRKPFDELHVHKAWEVALVIPVTVFDKYPLRLKAGTVLFANFYKCGDGLPVPHFVSWNPIYTEQPDFHRPECFGELVLLD